MMMIRNMMNAASISHASEIIVRTFARFASRSDSVPAVPFFTDFIERYAIRDMTSEGVLIPQQHRSPTQLTMNVTRLCVEIRLYLEAAADWLAEVYTGVKGTEGFCGAGAGAGADAACAGAAGDAGAEPELIFLGPLLLR